VSVENLTRDEARERARLLDVVGYDVRLDLTEATTDRRTFTSAATIEFGCREPGATTHLDITAERLHRATLNGSEIDVAAAFDGRRLQLPALAERNELVVEADCTYVRTGEGLHRFTDPVDGETYLYTHFETFDAHRMFACFDQPDLKATFRFTVEAPEHWVVVSNMSPQREGSTWTFPPTPRQSTYITALVAGPYTSFHDEHDGIPLGIYCRQSLAQYVDTDDIFTVTKQGFDFFHREFGYRYPWPKYDQLFVPEFNAGAMENAGAVTFLEDYIFRSRTTAAAYERRAGTILHELAHMWFGNLVTMRWWDDLWLNESFAEYASTDAVARATKYRDIWTTFATLDKAWAYRQDQLPTTHPVATDIVDIESVNVNFDGITYVKGASVLKQLVFYVGPDAFVEALRSYFARHEFGNTTLQDFLDALSEASGRDVTAWAKEWLQTAGLNTLRPRVEVAPDGTYSSFTIEQTAPEAQPTLRTHRLRVGLYDRTGEGLVRRQQAELDVTGPATEVKELIGQPAADLVLVNDDDLAYAKIRLDERSLATVVADMAELRGSLPRALCWGAAWDMTRDAEMAAGDFLELFLAGCAGETDVSTVQTQLSWARAAIVNYGTPSATEARTERLAATLERLMRAAEPGSDLQLAYARGFAANAISTGQLDLVAGLLSGSETVDGLEVDTDLRWLLLDRLVTLGRAGADEIDAELARDDTAAGRRHALELRAARPTAAAKAEAWDLVLDPDALPNAEQAAVIAGFNRPEHLELIAPYVEQFFSAAGDVWAHRTNEMAQQWVNGMFPRWHIDQATIDRADAYLREAEPMPLRKLLTDGRDNMARALRARERDAAG
jgi:aminopeptidase N